MMEKYPGYKQTKVNWEIELILLFAMFIWKTVIDAYQYDATAKTLLLIPVLIPGAILIYLGRWKTIVINDYFVIFHTNKYFPHKIPITWITSVYTGKVGKFETSSSKVEKYWVDVLAKTKVYIHLKNRKA